MDIFATVTVIGVSVVNGDLLNWAGGSITLQNLNDTAKIINNSSFSISSDGTIAGTGSLSNTADGTMEVLPQPGSTPTILCQFSNLGIINLLQSRLVVGNNWTMAAPGKLHFDGGNFQVDGTFDLQGTIRVLQPGSLMADLVSNNGVIDFRNGQGQTLNIVRRVGMMTGGNYTQGIGGSLFLEIVGDDECDILGIFGQATLAGILDISLGGGYVPAGQESLSWMFLKYGTRNGTFATVNRPANFAGPVYGIISATIKWTPP
jgi:hypothetical protein